ncbi:MAG: gliding motility-associated C-terminal domain-containing protein [Crocinitomicaceae bacterium]|nr:gliding motility-associated C-terminal domain-containing protein [Crocinitomicaceae bacterium]
MKFLNLNIILFCFGISNAHAQLFPNGDFELGTGAGCACATNFICGNDAGRVVDGTHPVFVVGNMGCISSPTNYTNVLGAHSGTGYMYFYAGADNYRTSATYNFAGGEEVCFSVWYCGPQGSGAPGQNTANAHFSFGVDGVQVGPDVLVPVNTGWTEHTFTMFMTPGAHYFSILSGGAAQYSIWTDDFHVDLCSVVPCDGSWTVPSPVCSDDPDINLTALITGDVGGTWSGTGVTGTNFDPSVGTQSITYTAPCGDVVTQTITVSPAANANWNPPGAVCSNASDINLNSLITGTAGGTWSGVGVTGNLFDPSAGTQSITYSVGTAPCDDIVTNTITVTPSSDPSWTTPGTICETSGTVNLSATITGTAGGTWTGTGVTGTTFDPAGLSGPVSITYTVGAAPCLGVLTQNIVVAPDVDPTWTAPLNLCTSSAVVDLNTTLTGTTGGTWSGTGVTGSNFNPASGTQSITYTVGTAPCTETSTLIINVAVAPDPSWSTVSVCEYGPDVNLNTLVTGTAGGTWSGTGVTGNMFDPSAGTQSVTYSISSGACSATSTQSISVSNPALTITGVNTSCFGSNDGSATVTVTGGSGTYTYSWTTMPVQTTSTATNLTAGAYTVTVTDVNAGCSVSEDIIITEPMQIVLVMDSVSACAPSSGTACVNVSGGSAPYTYVWNNSTSTSDCANDLDSAMQTVTVTDNNGCSATDSVFVIVYPATVLSISADTTILNGGEASLWANGGVSYLWTPFTDLSCDDCPNPIADPLDTTVYCVTATDINGCQSTACTTVRVEIICGQIFVPNAFSPNFDDENDILCVYSNCMETMSFAVYDRWGEKVFETSSMNVCWDGTYREKPMNSGIYVYKLEGTLITGTKVSQSGNVTLVR